MRFSLTLLISISASPNALVSSTGLSFAETNEVFVVALFEANNI
jgi:hypothetical protein